MGDIAVQTISRTGLSPVFVAANAGGDTFTNTGREYLHVKNGGAASINVTVDSKVMCNHGFDHDIVVAVAAGAEELIGPFPADRFTDSTTGKANVSYSVVTTVTVAVKKM